MLYLHTSSNLKNCKGGQLSDILSKLYVNDANLWQKHKHWGENQEPFLMEEGQALSQWPEAIAGQTSNQ